MMRKILYVLLMLLLIAAVAHGEVESYVSFSSTQSKLDVTVSGLIPGNEYFLLVTRADASGSDVLDKRMYMCVVAASEAGEIKHTVLSQSLTKDIQVLLGGVFEDGISPRVLDYKAISESFLPRGLTEIDQEAFMGASLTSIHIGAHITRIGDRAFKNCADLHTVYIDNAQVEFGEDVFAGCPRVEIVCSKDSTAVAYAEKCSNVTCRFE